MGGKRRRVVGTLSRKRRKIEHVNEATEHAIDETSDSYLNPMCNPAIFIDFENNVDDEKPPLSFKYLTKHMWHPSYPKPEYSEKHVENPCACTSSNRTCAEECICQKDQNIADGNIDSDRPFYLKPFTLLPTTIMECNKYCGCDPKKCRNRLLQNKRSHKIKLAVTKEPGKGWGIRARQDIGKGYLICEYVGEIISESEADKRGKVYDKSKLSYLWTQGGGDGMTSGGTIDATHFGNIARFANHSCNPNCFAVEVLIDSRQSAAQPRIAFFAGRDIKYNEEITIDYSYSLDVNEDGAIPCKCGSEFCRGRIR